MAPLATTPGDVYEFVIQAQDTACAVRCVNVFHVLAVTPNCTALQVVNDWRTNLETEWTDCFAGQVRIQRYLCFNLVPFQTDVYQATVDVPGRQSVTSMPPIVTAIFTWRTGRIGRRYRGRTYMAGVPTPDTLNGSLQPSYIVGRAKTFADKMIGRWGAGGSSPDIRLGIWSRVIGGQQPPHDKTGLTIVQSYTVQSRLGTMGTRRVGRGP